MGGVKVRSALPRPASAGAPRPGAPDLGAGRPVRTADQLRDHPLPPGATWDDALAVVDALQSTPFLSIGRLGRSSRYRLPGRKGPLRNEGPPLPFRRDRPLTSVCQSFRARLPRTVRDRGGSCIRTSARHLSDADRADAQGEGAEGMDAARAEFRSRPEP